MPSDLSISVEHNMLIIQGQRLPRHCTTCSPHPLVAPPPTPSISQPEKMLVRPLAIGIQEFHYGKFYRALRLPSGTDIAGIRATLADGVLTVTWPRAMTDENHSGGEK
ncbi:hypothetical protein B0H13DRAFT_1911616 [Mycena leptocephala]|nr:hypothetical protein B0H13DRAFT_1911616 [Mycena leptocephala]